MEYCVIAVKFRGAFNKNYNFKCPMSLFPSLAVGDDVICETVFGTAIAEVTNLEILNKAAIERATRWVFQKINKTYLDMLNERVAS